MKFSLIFGIIIYWTLVLVKIEGTNNPENPEFETPDLSVEYTRRGKVIHLEAFKTTENDKIIQNKNANEYGKLKWKSIGEPCLIPTDRLRTTNSNSKWYKAKTTGFFIQISMLTPYQKEYFKKAIIDKYKIVVDSKQIEHLVASSVKCSIDLVCKSKKNSTTLSRISGKAKNLRVFPLRIEFDANRQQMSCLKDVEKNGHEIDIDCTTFKTSKQSKMNTLTIEYNQLAENNIIDKLFGDAESVYISRDQISDVSQEVFGTLKIREEYDIGEKVFKENFVDEIIKKATEFMYKPVNFDIALRSLSKYNMDDIKPDVVKSDFERLFEVKKTADKSHIILNKEHYNKIFNKDSENYEGSASGSGFFMSASASAKAVTDRERLWENSGKSLDDQLEELNRESTNEIEWKREGDKIIPKSIKLSKLIKAKLKNGFKLERVRIEKKDVLFERMFTLHSNELVKDTIEENETSISPRPYPLGMVSMIASSKVDEWFNEKGQGTGEYFGWYVCDGRNGTPDLRGRFLVGRDSLSNSSEYKQVGNTGGQDEVQLTESQMPSHTHIDNGHSHGINLVTSIKGSHQHRYHDVFFSENSGNIEVPEGKGNYGRSDNDNKGWQMPRDTEYNGDHIHTVTGDSSMSYARLARTGNNTKHENRPPYYVVVYITFLG